jgi:predicted NAD/FAD-binding protein
MPRPGPCRSVPVTVYDRDIRPGGHSHTATIDYDGKPLVVDIDFIVYNELNDPDLTALFDHLGVETTESYMSFAVTADAGRFDRDGSSLRAYAQRCASEL